MLQHGSPVFLSSLASDDHGIRLDPLQNNGDAKHHDEAFIRDLIHRSPGILPISEIEPIFDDACSICIELPNPAGFADNLLVTPDGGIVLVECKLQRNLQARREVIAQIMDYAAQLQSWTFEDLDAAIRKADLPDGGKPCGLLEYFEERDDFDPLAFMDAITRNLRLGRMLLLIVGDGIREGLESLAAIIQRHPGFHAALGLVELKIYSVPTGGYIVQPRTLLRTLIVERGVVTFSDSRIAIQSSEPSVVDASSTAIKRPSSLTEEEYYTILASKLPTAPAFLRAFVQKMESLGLTWEFQRSLIFRWTGIDGLSYNIMTIRKHGWVYLDAVSWKFKTTEELALVNAYRQSIAEAVAGEVREDKNSNVYVRNCMITVEDLQRFEDAIIKAVDCFVRNLRALEASR